MTNIAIFLNKKSTAIILAIVLILLSCAANVMVFGELSLTTILKESVWGVLYFGIARFIFGFIHGYVTGKAN